MTKDREEKCQSCWEELDDSEDTLCIWCMIGCDPDDYEGVNHGKKG